MGAVERVARLGRVFQRARPRRAGNGRQDAAHGTARWCARTTSAGSPRPAGRRRSITESGGVVDLRFADESPGEPDAHADVEVVADLALRPSDPIPTTQGVRGPPPRRRRHRAQCSRPGTSHVLEARAGASRRRRGGRRRRRTPTTASSIHCFAGKDRTGIVTALLLLGRRRPRRTRSPPTTRRVTPTVGGALRSPWVARARDDDERETRAAVGVSSPTDDDGRPCSPGSHDGWRRAERTSPTRAVPRSSSQRLERRLVAG